MSGIRPIWNDGQGLATPDLQRGCDLVGNVDDRGYEVLLTPGAVQKRIVPLLEETSSVFPILLATPSSTAGAVRVQPCELIAGSASSQQQINLSATMYSTLDTALITSNSSGLTRYDLVYATVNRQVSVTGARKIKSATDGSLSSQTINLADAPAVTLGVNVGFLTGATAPTAAQIAAALPADTNPSSSTFGTFNFPIAYVTVPNLYSSGTVLAQDPSTGTCYITQCWSRGFVRNHRLRGMRPASIYSGSANEKVSSALTGMTANAERWSSGPHCMFAHCKILSTTGGTLSAGTTLDNTVDWRNRVVWGFWSYTGSASVIPIESTGSGVGMNVTPPGIAGTTLGSSVAYTGVLPPAYIQNGFVSGALWVGQYATSSAASFQMNVNQVGQLVIFKNGFAPIDATNGDLLMFVIYYSDRLRTGI